VTALKKLPSSKKKIKNRRASEDDEEEKYDADDSEDCDEEYESSFAAEAGSDIAKKGYSHQKQHGKYDASGGKNDPAHFSGSAGEKFAALETSLRTVIEDVVRMHVKESVSEMAVSAGITDEKYIREIGNAVDPAKAYAGVRPEMVKLSYNDPVFINNQWTYQRIFINSGRDGLNVHELTAEKMKSGDLDASFRYDEKFRTFYFDSMNGIRDGQNMAYWEVWVNGHIVEDAIDQTPVKKGDMVEWRLANEREEGCGGGSSQKPDFLKPLFNRPGSGYPHGLGFAVPYGGVPQLQGMYGFR
jgi:hypothetical protein